MAQDQNHISFSLLSAAGYAGIGLLWWNIYPEHILLACVLAVIGGLLPNIDTTGSLQERELAGFLAAVVPLYLLSEFPGLEAGGVSRIALVVILAYAVTRLVVGYLLSFFTAHRGMIHSIPAAIVAWEAAYLSFSDLYWTERLFVSGGLFVGYLSHLILDAATNRQVVANALGQKCDKIPAMKWFGSKKTPTLAIYLLMFFLGYHVWIDLGPHLIQSKTII